MFDSVSLEAALIFMRGVFLIGACAVLAWAVLRWRKQMERDSQRLFEQLDIALVEVRVMQEHVLRMEQRIQALAGQMEEGARQPPQAAAPAARGYDLAVRLAKRGAPADELVSTCGITRHEAELLRRLHGERIVEGPVNPRAARMPQPVTEAPAATETQRATPARKKGSLLAVG